MKKLFQIIYFVFAITICSCSQKENSSKKLQSKFTLSEKFTDSMSIGNPQNNKLELLKYVNEIDNKSYVLVKLFQRENNHWKLTFKDTVNADGLAKIAPEIKDYNSDKLNDLKFCSKIGANLANSMNVVLIYSAKTESLKKIGRGWNLTYSEKLKMFREKYRASTIWASYYKIDKDRLIKTFEIDLGATSELVKEYDGKGKLIKTLQTNRDTINYELPKVKHWLREWTIKETLN